MRGITYINGDMYYERPDGTYARMPYDDGVAVAKILIEKFTEKELEDFLAAALRTMHNEDPERVSSLLQWRE